MGKAPTPTLDSNAAALVKTTSAGQQKPNKRRNAKAKAAANSAAPVAPKTFEFISTDPLAKQQPDTRAFIRSYVMRGKNTKKRNKVTEAPAEADRDRLPSDHAAAWSHYAGLASDTTRSGRQPSALVERSKVTNRGYARAFDKEGSTTVEVLSVFFPAPIKAPHDMSLWNFSRMLDYKGMLQLHNFFGVLKESMFPVEWCFLPDSTKSCWFRWLCESESYLNSVLLTVACVQDLFKVTQTTTVEHTSGRLPVHLMSPTTRLYMRNTVSQLHERLQNPETCTDDITVAIVIALANIADITGDAEACASHVTGLKKIVNMRGGMKKFDNTQLVSKMSRIDLGWALKYGVAPEFCDEDMSWEPHLDNTILLESPVAPDNMSSEVRHFVDGMDHRLRNIFADLQAFGSVANKLVNSRRKLRPDLFQEIMLSIQYRLMLLEYDTEVQPIEEAIRLGLLSFQTSVFIQMKAIRVKYDYIMVRLKTSLSHFPETTPGLADLKLWIHLMAAIALYDPEQTWIEEGICRLTAGRPWEEVYVAMRSIMWLDLVHDAPGRMLFNSACCRMDEIDLGLGRDRTQFLDFGG